MSSNQYRIAVLDIENFPAMGYAWSAQERYPTRQNLIDVERAGCIASFAYKWDGDHGDPVCVALPDFKRAYKNDPFDDTLLMERMYEVLEEADLVTGHNINRFDVRKVNARLMREGHNPPSPSRTYDTYIEAQKLIDIPSYSLNAIAKFLGCPWLKMEHEGFPLWLKSMAGIMEAWGRFKRYNIRDVKISQWVYHRMRPWSRSHPNITLLGDEDNLCPVCGYKTKRIERLGLLKSYSVERWRCQRKSCGKTSFGRRVKLDIEVLSS